MSHVTLEYNLPEEEAALHAAMIGSKAIAAIEEFSNELRKIRKYEEHSEVESALIQRISDIFCEIMKDVLK